MSILTATQFKETEESGIILPDVKVQNPTLHLCPNWDYMAIDYTCPEWEARLCAGPRKVAKPLPLASNSRSISRTDSLWRRRAFPVKAHERLIGVGVAQDADAEPVDDLIICAEVSEGY